MNSRNRYPYLALFVLLLIIISAAWVYNSKFRKERTIENCVCPQVSIDTAVLTVSQRISETPAQPQEPKPIAQTHLFSYVDPPKTVSGTADEEHARFELYLSTQGAICKRLGHFGGHLDRTKRYPENDPDGIWYMCLDKEGALMANNCIVYSFGISNDWSFDESINKKYGCNVYCFDPTIRKDDHFHAPKIQFFNTAFSNVDFPGIPGKDGKDRKDKKPEKKVWKTRTLKTIIKELGHENKLIDLLKMDIEGEEWNSLEQVLADGTLKKYVKQMDVEFHIDRRNIKKLIRYNGVLQWLDRQGFKLIYMHRNMICGICYEVTFVNTDLVKIPIR